MLVLAFDSSTNDVSVAVVRAADEPTQGPREVLVEISVPSRGASEALLPAAHAALGLAGTTLEGIERVLVGVGPGTFTGIRIAAAAARSLALATGAPLSKGSTLAALAAPALASADVGDVLAVIDARRREVFAQRYAADGGVPGEILCVRPAELRAGGAPLVVGDGAVRYREVLSGLGRIPDDASPLHRVTATGLALSADLAPVPAGEVVPLYVREPDAEVRRDLNPWSKA
ncbi:tRNA (adenosine(37)-N6)-threonylcarbamoyltransferase complex dimerization subunit type 1 TsaB [Rubrobacter marinus]|uniref:tRNA (adenosine(37)-N6)-threonylcarbamoyltransferase complex dimerization subunit type 1 TsaB n=1 Tax=Rubrobacter marinus TaxID=2653852 RepID=UPI001409BFFA|nr:tRNA (adenosine(37)-N6)-threonylcarbamoyltransferase complex dimerization subunit type 1 TsaB [Rubrobacter marinus]